MSLKNLSNQELLSQTLSLVREERRISLLVIEHLEEIESRRLHAREGFSSLFDYATRVLGYSEVAAMRRIQSMRLLKRIPEVKEKIADGKLTVATLAQVESYVRLEKKSVEETRELLVQMEGKSKREVERVLRVQSEPDTIRLELFVSRELYGKIKELQIQEGVTSVEALLGKLVSKAKRKELVSPVAVNENKRQVPRALKSLVVQADDARCAYVSPGGMRCNSTRTEIDHVEPFQLGGPTRKENLRLLCRPHNQLEAENAYGRKKVGTRSG
jgi:hypothetical protein